MTPLQAYNVVKDSHNTAREHAAAVTLGTYRYFVRCADGTPATDVNGAVIESHDLAFMKGARLHLGGDIVDRWNWRNDSLPLVCREG